MTTTAHVDTFAMENLPARDQWPEFLFDLPELQYPERLNCVAELLDKTAASGHADRPAIYSRQGMWTYAQLQERVNRVAHVLREDMKLVPGNRVLLRGDNNPMMAACMLAVIKAGCIAVPTMSLLRAKELCVIIQKARVNAVLCSENLKEEMELARSQCAAAEWEPTAMVYFNGAGPGTLEAMIDGKPSAFDAVDTAADDICLIAFTSGTTGMPKGTMHCHRDVMAICDCFPRSTLRSQSDDVFIGTPPLAFTFGLGGLLLFPMRAGAATVLLEKLSPETLLQAVQDFRATICFTAPTFYRQMAPSSRASTCPASGNRYRRERRCRPPPANCGARPPGST